MSTFIKAPPKVSAADMVTFQPYDVEVLMEHHDLDEDARNIIRTEKLVPTSLLSRLHNNYLSIPY